MRTVRLTGPFYAPALLVVLISSFSQNFLNVYGGAISVQTLRIPVSRRTAVVFICAAAYLISLWGGEGFEAKFKTFLFVGAYLIAPFGAVLLLDYVFGRRHDRARMTLELCFHPALAARFGRMQQIPALRRHAVATQFVEASRAPHVGEDAEVRLEQIRG